MKAVCIVLFRFQIVVAMTEICLNDGTSMDMV